MVCSRNSSLLADQHSHGKWFWVIDLLTCHYGGDHSTHSSQLQGNCAAPFPSSSFSKNVTWSSPNFSVISQTMLFISHGNFAPGRRSFWCYYFHQQIHRAGCQWDALQSGQCHQISSQPEHCPQGYQAGEFTGKWRFIFQYCWWLGSVWEKVCTSSFHMPAKFISVF